MIRKIKYWLYIVWLSSKWVFRVTLKDYVLYRGKRYIVTNGVPSGYWTLRIPYSDSEKLIVKHQEVKKIWSIKGMYRSFKSGYSFYMLAWYDIWCRNGIEDWCRKCNIW